MALLLFGAAIQANAQTGGLVNWHFEDPIDSSTNPSTNPNSVSAGITAAITTGPGITNVSVTSPGSDGANPCISNTALSGSCFALSADGFSTPAFDPNRYFEFRVTLDTAQAAYRGCSIRPTSFVSGGYRVDGGDFGSYEVRTSTDNFATRAGAVGGVMASFSGISRMQSPQFGIPGQISFAVRVYFWGTTNSVRIDRVRIAGTINCPMPVEFASFEGKAVGNRVQLNWATSLERNADRFEIQRSQDAAEFGSIGQVKATGESTQKQVYGFTDEQALSGINYYRLRQVDKDGSVQFSKIIAVTTRPEALAIAVLGNPTEGGRIRLQLFNLEAANLRLTDMQGRPVAFRLTETESTKGLVTLEPANPLSTGMYLVGAANVPAVKIVVR